MTGIRSEQHSPVINVPTGSAEVSTANAKARATLPTFWASYEASKPSETGHSLKMRFSNKTNDGGHIRMAEVKELADGRYSGRLANEPRYLAGKRVGDLVEFKEADIFDWMFMRDGKIVGGETIRVLPKSLPKATPTPSARAWKRREADPRKRAKTFWSNPLG